MKLNKYLLSGVAAALLFTLAGVSQARNPSASADAENFAAVPAQKNGERRAPPHAAAPNDAAAQTGDKQPEGRGAGHKPAGPMDMLFASEELFSRMQHHRLQRTQQLHAQLQLAPAQEQAWQHLQSSIQNKVQEARKLVAQQGLNAQQLQAQALPQRIESLQQLHAQVQPLMSSSRDELKAFYQTLDPAQKKIMDKQYPLPMAPRCPLRTEAVIAGLRKW